jgi:hypothetical protein
MVSVCQSGEFEQLMTGAGKGAEAGKRGFELGCGLLTVSSQTGFELSQNCIFNDTRL